MIYGTIHETSTETNTADVDNNVPVSDVEYPGSLDNHHFKVSFEAGTAH